jgi:hypothetical protein
MKILGSIKDIPIDQILKGKRPVLLAGAEPRLSSSVKKPPDMPWLKPPSGWVKLPIDCFFKSENGSAGTGMVLCNSVGPVIFSDC